MPDMIASSSPLKTLLSRVKPPSAANGSRSIASRSTTIGYALCTRSGLDAIAKHLGALQPEQVDILRGKLCIGLHRDVEVTDAAGEHRPLVSQAFCSALPVAYTRVPPSC